MGTARNEPARRGVCFERSRRSRASSWTLHAVRPGAATGGGRKRAGTARGIRRIGPSRRVPHDSPRPPRRPHEAASRSIGPQSLNSMKSDHQTESLGAEIRLILPTRPGGGAADPLAPTRRPWGSPSSSCPAPSACNTAMPLMLGQLLNSRREAGADQKLAPGGTCTATPPGSLLALVGVYVVRRVLNVLRRYLVENTLHAVLIPT